MFSVYNYGISEEDYYRSMADTLITKKLMTSKVFLKRSLVKQTLIRFTEMLKKASIRPCQFILINGIETIL